MQLQKIASRIYEIRGMKVMLDFDLAELYEVETRVLNQAVKRNSDLFPSDFMFRLHTEEWKFMSSQFVTTYPTKRPKSSSPYAFTEHGVAMLANVLKSKKARVTSVSIVRAFIALKKFSFSYDKLAEKIKSLENQYHKQFKDIYQAIDYLLEKDKIDEDQKTRKRIGY